jgi:RNA polymerase sigma-70 factor (ECF subfamily)
MTDGTFADDQTLVDACLNGNTAAWQEFVERAGPVVWRVLWRFFAKEDNQHREDAFQDIFVKLLSDDFRLLRKFDSSRGTLALYLAMIARTTALENLRRENKRPVHHRLDDLNPQEIATTSSLDELPDIEDWQLDAALATLGEREREIILLFYQQHLSTSEIAEKLATAEATIRSAKRNALNKIRIFFKI